MVQRRRLREATCRSLGIFHQRLVPLEQPAEDELESLDEVREAGPELEDVAPQKELVADEALPEEGLMDESGEDLWLRW